MNKFPRFLFLLACTLLLGAKSTPQFKIDGIKGEALANVQFRLSELFQNKSIANEPPALLQQQIQKAIYPYGLFKPQVILNYVPPEVFITIHPGPQMHIASLTLRVEGEGAQNIEIQKAFHNLAIKQGQAFNNKLYVDAKDQLFSAAENQGFLHATFQKAEVRLDMLQYKAEIILIFDTGPQYYYGQLHFDPTYINPELLNRFVPFKMGEAYSTEKILTLNSNLTASGYFNSVVVKPQIGKEQNVPIFIHMQPVPRTNYSYSVGYGTDTGPRGRVGYHVTPVNRFGHKFNAIAQGSMKENALLAQYIIPGANPVTDKYSISGSFTNLSYNSGNGNALLLSLAQQHALNNFQRILSINGLSERFNYIGEPNTTESLLFPKATLTWRKVEEQLFSSSGYNFTFTALGANKLLLSQINILQATVEAKAAITVEPMRTRLYFHGIQGFTQIKNINDLPLSLAMLLGGSENLKGYSYNSIGPGKTLTYVGLEVQKETFQKWYLVGFFDAGDVYRPVPRNFLNDVGLGLMWVSPVGPIKIGVAQAVDHRFQRVKDRNPKLIISMGPDI